MGKMESCPIPNMWHMVQSPTFKLLTNCALMCWYVCSFGAHNTFHKAVTSETKWLDEELDRKVKKINMISWPTIWPEIRRVQ